MIEMVDGPHTASGRKFLRDKLGSIIIIGYMTIMFSACFLVIYIMSLVNLENSEANEQRSQLITYFRQRNLSNLDLDSIPSMNTPKIGLYFFIIFSILVNFWGVISGVFLIFGILWQSKKLVACWMTYAVGSCIWSLGSIVGLYNRVHLGFLVGGAAGNVILFFLGLIMIILSSQKNQQHPRKEQQQHFPRSATLPVPVFQIGQNLKKSQKKPTIWHSSVPEAVPVMSVTGTIVRIV